jgi:hypothetical protein
MNRGAKLIAGALGVAAVQLAWWWAVALATHLYFYDRPVPRDAGAVAALSTLQLLPLVLAALYVVRLLLRRGRGAGRK